MPERAQSAKPDLGDSSEPRSPLGARRGARTSLSIAPSGSDERFRSILTRFRAFLARFWTNSARFWTLRKVDFGALSKLSRSSRPTRSKSRRFLKNHKKHCRVASKSRFSVCAHARKLSENRSEVASRASRATDCFRKTVSSSF